MTGPNELLGLGAQLVFPGAGVFRQVQRWLPPTSPSVAVLHAPSTGAEFLRAFGQGAADLGMQSRFLAFSSPRLTMRDIQEIKVHLGTVSKLGLVAVGGGSVLDAAKILAGELGPLAYLIAAPTTVGSGAEATPFATYYVGATKKSLVSERLPFDRVVLDPELCHSLPAKIIRSSGLDAFSQALESAWSRYATAASRSDSLAALPLIYQSLPRALAGERAALADLQIGAYLAGRAIGIAKTTLSHGLSYYLTAHWHVPHGEAVARTLAAVCDYNCRCPDKEVASPLSRHELQQRLAQIHRSLTGHHAGALGTTVLAFLNSVAASSGTADLPGFDEVHLERMINGALESGRAQNNPRLFNRKALKAHLHAPGL